jgi:hypothetical protein
MSEVIDCVIDCDSLRCARCGLDSVSCKTRRNCHPKVVLPQTLTAGGPGTELSKLLKLLGIEPTPTCQCRAKAAQMDALGADECSKPERIAEAVAVMREEAKARGLPFLDAAGRVLVRRAIHIARKAEAARAKEAQQKGPPAV